MATYEVNDLSITKDGNTYQIKLANNVSFYGTCDTAGGTQQKVVTINDFEEPRIGMQISITFNNAQAYNGYPTLKINDLEAVTVINGFKDMWGANETVNFVFSGTYWLYIGSGIASISGYGITKLTNSLSSATDMAITPSAVNDVVTQLDSAINRNLIGATSNSAGVAGRVPAPVAGDQNKYLKGDGTWGVIAIPEALPTDPVSNGTYVLLNTVSNGTPTHSWLAVSYASGGSF